MSRVVFHILADSSDEGPRWVRSSIKPYSYWALWDGLPPLPLPNDVAGIAAVGLQGDLDGRRVYAEQVPLGLPLDRADPPATLENPILWSVLEVVRRLHAVNHVHGQVARDRVFLTAEGEVILVGRGRVGGLAVNDVDAVSQLFERTAVAGEVTLPGRSLLSSAQVEEMRAWIGDQAASDLPVVGQLAIEIGGYPTGDVDEVIPDLGPDSGRGFLDPWSLSDSGWDVTAERTDVGIKREDHDLLVELWGRVAAGSQEGVPDDRFAAIEGQPSRGIRSLLQREWPASLPVATTYSPLMAEGADEASEDPMSFPIGRSSPAWIFIAFGLVFLSCLALVVSLILFVFL